MWRARDTVEQRNVAIKVTRPEVARELGRDALEREARIGARLQHPNVASVRNADWVDGFFVITTELARCNLAEYVRARRSPRVALQVIRDATAGLAHAHARHILHRDIKPENVLVFPDGRAAIADFGVSAFARGATRTHTEAGTLGYMAPEQAYGRPRPASDVFSLGLIAYQTLTGVLPTWPFEWPPERVERFEARVPAPLQPVLRRAFEFDPRRRHADAGVMLAAFDAAVRRWERELQRRKRPAPAKRPRRRTAVEASPFAVAAEVFRRRHGRGLDLHFRCHRCDGPISEAMRYCPWCGADDNSFVEVSRFPLVCPDCERGVLPEWTACPWCYPTRFEGNGRPPRADARAERRCSRRGCSGRLRPFMRYCPVCKTRTRRPWTHPDLPDRCPRCRWSVSRDAWRFCAWCGRHEPAAGSYRRTR